jgi:hypothetical protein
MCFVEWTNGFNVLNGSDGLNGLSWMVKWVGMG